MLTCTCQQPSCSILNYLQTRQSCLVNSYIYSVTVIESRKNEGMDEFLKINRREKRFYLARSLRLKKHDLTTLLICLSNLSSLSNQTPKFFTATLLCAARGPKCTFTEAKFSICPNKIISVNQHIIIISEGSCDSKDWSNSCWKFSCAFSWIHYILKYIQNDFKL